jgi:hypothetical protein
MEPLYTDIFGRLAWLTKKVKSLFGRVKALEDNGGGGGVTGVNSITGNVVIQSTPTIDVAAGTFSGGGLIDLKAFGVDNSSNTVDVPSGENHDIPNFSGMLIVNDHYNGSVEVWIAGGGNDTVLLNRTPYGPGPGDLSINPAVNGYTWNNLSSATGPFTFTVIKTRNTA